MTLSSFQEGVIHKKDLVQAIRPSNPVPVPAPVAPSVDKLRGLKIGAAIGVPIIILGVVAFFVLKKRGII